MIKETIGRILEDGTIERGCTNQGKVYKNYEAFENKKGTCYVAELSDDEYEYSDFLEEAKGDDKIARVIFDMVDWQSPCTMVCDMLHEEMILCDVCDKYYLTHGEKNVACHKCSSDRG